MICVRQGGKIEIQSLDFFVSFFVKQKRKANRIIFQIKSIIHGISLIRLFIGAAKAYTQIYFNRIVVYSKNNP